MNQEGLKNNQLVVLSLEEHLKQSNLFTIKRLYAYKLPNDNNLELLFLSLCLERADIVDFWLNEEAKRCGFAGNRGASAETANRFLSCFARLPDLKKAIDFWETRTCSRLSLAEVANGIAQRNHSQEACEAVLHVVEKINEMSVTKNLCRQALGSTEKYVNMKVFLALAPMVAVSSHEEVLQIVAYSYKNSWIDEKILEECFEVIPDTGYFTNFLGWDMSDVKKKQVTGVILKVERNRAKQFRNAKTIQKKKFEESDRKNFRL